MGVISQAQAQARAKKPSAKPSAKVPTKVPAKKKPPLYKPVKNGERLSAAAYFKYVAGGKLYNCKPKYICQPDRRDVRPQEDQAVQPRMGRALRQVGQCLKWLDSSS